MIPLKEKDETWRKACMDSLESIGRKQFLENIGIIENYRMVNNELLYNHYVFSESVTDLAQLATKEFDLPPYLRHYDIIRKIINVLSGEYQKRPDNFRVAAIDEFSQNEYIREKTELLINSVVSKIQQSVDTKLKQKGFDIEEIKQLPQDQQEQAFQQYEQAKQEMTPEDIELYMKENYRGVAEQWAEMILKLDKQRFNTPELETQEFEDMLICDRAFRHFYLKANGLGYAQETWNPIRVFFHKSPDLKYVEDGDYVGRCFYLSLPEIINRYGHKMSKKQLEALYGDYLSKKKNGGAEYSFFQSTNVPFENYPEYARTLQAFGQDPHTGNPFPGTFSGSFSTQDVDVLFNSSSTTYNLQGLIQATEAYWKSQKKIGFLIAQDPITGEIIEEIVDETFEVPSFIKEVNDDPDYKDLVFSPQKRMNTIRWTWVNEIWGGIKVNSLLATTNNTTKSSTPATGIYIDVKPLPFQFKGDSNPYETKLPVCGAIFNNRNARSMSIVDMLKSYQVLYNVFMNKIFQLASTDIGKVLLLDPRLIPNDKDHGGEKSLEKWVTATKNLKIGQIDTSPGARAGAQGSTQWSVQDMSTYDEIQATLNIARLIEEQAMHQIGVTQQRLGNIQASESATGVQQAVNNSFAQTESYFTKFSNYKKRVLQMNLDIAQFCAVKETDLTLTLIQDDMSREFLKVNGLDLLLSQLGVLVFNSQELIRQNELAKQLILKNNTTNSSMSALLQAIYTESPAKIIAIVKKAEEEFIKQQQAARAHEQELLDKQLQAKQQEKAQDQQFEAGENALDREAKIRETIIKVTNFDTDTQGNGVIDVVGEGKLQIEQQKINEQQNQNQRLNLNQQIDSTRKHLQEQDKIKADKEAQQKEHQLKKSEMKNKLEIEAAKKKQIDSQNKNQEKMQEKGIQADLTLKKLDIRLKEISNKAAARKSQTDTKINKLKELEAKDNLDTKKSLNKIKIVKAKAPKE